MKCKYSIIAIWFLLNTGTVYAQLDFKIDTLRLFNVIETIDNDVIDEDRGKGPFAMFYASIYNKTDTLVTINRAKVVYYISYYYKGKKYSFNSTPQGILDIDNLILSPNQKTELYFDFHLLLGTSIHKSDKGDYTSEMLEILPTLEVYYINRPFYIRSSEIRRVIVDNPYR